jgi:hypothetical protein
MQEHEEVNLNMNLNPKGMVPMPSDSMALDDKNIVLDRGLMSLDMLRQDSEDAENAENQVIEYYQKHGQDDEKNNNDIETKEDKIRTNKRRTRVLTRVPSTVNHSHRHSQLLASLLLISRRVLILYMSCE